MKQIVHCLLSLSNQFVLKFENLEFPELIIVGGRFKRCFTITKYYTNNKLKQIFISIVKNPNDCVVMNDIDIVIMYAINLSPGQLEILQFDCLVSW